MEDFDNGEMEVCDGKIISDENTEETRVGWPVYKEYFSKYLGGWKFVVIS